MTYIPPLNGGRINATIGGNTAGASTLVSTGTLTLAGGNNITLSQNGNAITISGPSAGAAGSQSIGISNLGNTLGTSGIASGSAVRYLFAGGNNVTLSQSVNGASGTVTISAASQSVQTQSLIQAIYDGANSISTGTIRFSNSNGINFGINGQTITASHNALTIQSNQTVGLYALGNTTQNSSTTLDARSISFNGLGAATVGYSNGSVQVSVPSQTVQSQNLFNLTLSGNTAGAMAQVSSGTLTLAGGNNVTLSQAGNAVTVSAANQTVQTQNVHNVTLSGNTAGAMAQISSGTLTLAGGNNITLSQAGNVVSIVGGAGGGGGGVAIANSETTYTSGTANFVEGGGAITIASTTGQSFQFSVPQTSSLSATGAVSISTNGSTISIGAPVAPTYTTLSRYDHPTGGVFTSLQTQGQGLLFVQNALIPYWVSGSAMRLGGSLSGVTNTSITTASANITLWMGIYTLNGSTLSLASSGSANNGFQWFQSNSSTANTSVNSMRQMTVPMNVNITPGQYWIAAVLSSATTYTNFSYWIYGNNLINPTAGAAALAPIGSNTSAGREPYLFQGIYTAAVSSGPASISSGQLNVTSASNVMRGAFYFGISNAAY